MKDENGEMTATYCGYKPYTMVTCTLIASNAAGNSSDQTETTLTLCAGKRLYTIRHVEYSKIFNM